MKLATYFLFHGEGKEAFSLYKNTFKAKELEYVLFTPEMTDNPKLVGQLFHAELKIEGFYLYLCDTDESISFDQTPIKITVESNSLEEAEFYFKQLRDGGEVIEPFHKQPWGAMMAELKDRFGVHWNIVYC